MNMFCLSEASTFKKLKNWSFMNPGLPIMMLLILDICSLKCCWKACMTYSKNFPVCFSCWLAKAFFLEILFSTFALSLEVFLATKNKWAIPSSIIMAQTYPSLCIPIASFSCFICMKSNCCLMRVMVLGGCISMD